MAQPDTPLLTTDCVICDQDRRIVLIQRKNEPFKGAYALPGGFVDVGETVEAACRREKLQASAVTVGDLRLCGF
jgi:8-oxo-dGTP diphosphatase